ncbi:chorismate transformation enzyme, FkbO/Hyg5 family [Acetobacter indonesiensis]|uniref:chorismate transformation enzyme, FkbO/Hyg5 family n=1 Tax=Acetobacter indonesiensis TaxID=104101 RepID=UPI0020A5B404|nr:hypothetical protein [Acetobacter indonesiensis]MCP1231468.1 hypothetical protein [Acetobacter indonesiensis]
MEQSHLMVGHNILQVSYGAFEAEHRSALAVVQYAQGNAKLCYRNGQVQLTIPYTHGECSEYWSTLEASSCRGGMTDQGIAWCEDGTNLFAAFILDDRPRLSGAVQEKYEALLSFVQEKEYRTLYRIWNYIGRINQSNKDGLERYQDFCLGRALAFERSGFTMETLPAATGIGFDEGGVCVYLLARRDGLAANIENPLQIPAYRYPITYGPKSPSFARGTVLYDQQRLELYLSGTASIRQSVSVGSNLEEQINITIENINALIENVKENEGKLDNCVCTSLKIYVRHAKDKAAVSNVFRHVFSVSPENSPVFVSDICRSELLLEVEGVFSYTMNK